MDNSHLCCCAGGFASRLPDGGWVAVDLHVPTCEAWLPLRLVKFWELFFKMFLNRNRVKRRSPFPLVVLPLTGVWVGGMES